MSDDYQDLKSAFNEIFQGRSNYQLDRFVVGSHCASARQYAQVVLELQNKYYALRRADVQRRRIIAQLKEAKGFDAEEMQIDLELVQIGIVGAQREFDYLYALWQSMPKFTNEQIQNAEESYWSERLLTQAAIDVAAHGAISTGNIEALRQTGIVRISGDDARNLVSCKILTSCDDIDMLERAHAIRARPHEAR